MSSPAPELAEPSAPPRVSGLRRVLANLAHLIGGKAAAGVMSLVYVVIVARTLGAHDYGVLILLTGYTTLVGSVVAFSGFHGMVRYGTIALEAGDRAELAQIARFMALIELACGVLAFLVALAAIPFVGPRLGWSADAMRIAPVYCIAVFSSVRATPQGLLQIAGRFDLIGVQQTVNPIIRLVGTLLMWALGAGLDGFLIVWLISLVAESVAMWGFGLVAWRKIAGSEPLIGRWRGLLRRIKGFGSFILLTNFDLTLRDLAPNLAPLTVGWILGPAAAGLYSLALRATTLFQQPALLLAQASYSVLVEQVAKRRLDLLRKTVWRSGMLALAVATPFVLVLTFGGKFVLPLIGGKSFTGGAALLALVTFARAANLFASPLSAGLTALGRPQRSMMVTLVTNLALYPALPLLLLWIGLDGAGWQAFGQALIATVMLAIFFAKDAVDRR